MPEVEAALFYLRNGYWPADYSGDALRVRASDIIVDEYVRIAPMLKELKAAYEAAKDKHDLGDRVEDIIDRLVGERHG